MSMLLLTTPPSPQDTAEWLQARVGKLTASRLSDAIAKTKSGGWGASREKYKGELVAERRTRAPYPQHQSEPMRWGSQCEPRARILYELVKFCDVVQVGFIEHPTIEMTGCSPDGLIGESGLIEIKCPNTVTHIQTLYGASIDKDYRDQMQWQMACTGRAWCDFVSFDPRLDEAAQLHIQRVERDQDYIDKLEKMAVEFLREVDEMYLGLNKIVGPAP